MGATADTRLKLSEVTFDPNNDASLAVSGIMKIIDNEDFSINGDNTMTVRRDGTMTILGHLGAQGGNYHYDKVLNGSRSVLRNQYGHYYDITELKQGDTLYFVYKNDQAYWWTGSAVIIFQ